MENDDIADLFAALGTVAIRRMFSGKGVYVDGVIVAIEHGGELRLKADAVSAPAFAAAGAMQWAYDGNRGMVMLPYWSIPDEALDQPEAMAGWARLALEAGLRASTGKPQQRQRKSRGSSSRADPV